MVFADRSPGVGIGGVFFLPARILRSRGQFDDTEQA